MDDGVLLVDKPLGMTSRDVVNKVCKILKTKKIGHTGTLDPNASGVLVLCVGPSTKIVQFLTSEDKEYVAEITLGISSDTLDLDGEILRREAVSEFSEEKLLEVLENFKGASKQVPPMYSAIKINGKRLHELAREGKEVERKERDIFIQSLDLISHLKFEDGMSKFKIQTRVSKGTYIRTLAADIGEALGYPALMSSLRRISQGEFDISDSHTLEQIEANEFTYISKSDAMKSMNHFEITDSDLMKRINNGAIIDRVNESDEDVALYYEDKILAVYKIYSKDNMKMKPVRVFRDESN